MGTFVAAIDCGTSAVKAAVFDLAGNIKGFSRKQCPCRILGNGRIEQSPALIERTALACLKEAVSSSRVKPARVAAVSVSSQRATVIPLDGKGAPLGNAVSWQDMRGADSLAPLRAVIPDEKYYAITGLPNNPVFTLAKVLRLRSAEPGRYGRTAKFALVHDYVMSRLGAPGIFTDHSNASLTGMFDIAKRRWSGEILAACGLPAEKLPEPVPPGTKIGFLSKEAAGRTGLPAGTTLVAGGGDQQCAGVGAGAVKPGLAEMTLGTAGVLLSYTDRIVKDPLRRVTCCCHAVPGAWEVEGLQNSCGASLDWLAKLIDGEGPLPESLFREARLAGGPAGALFYPHFTGAAAPSWDPDARAMFLGLDYAHDRARLAAAVIHGVSMETRRIMDVFAGLGLPLRRINLTGGCTRNRTWVRTQADIYGKEVGTLKNPEAALLGAGILAACGAGAFRSVAEASGAMVRADRTYRPVPGRAAGFKKAYDRYCSVYGILEKTGLFKLLSGGKP